MKFKNINIITIAIVVVVIIIAYKYLQKNPLKTSNTTNSGASKSTTNTTGGGVNLPVGSYPIRNGSVSIKVKALQEALNKYPTINLVTDGIFGPKTAAAVQFALGLQKAPSEVTEEMFKRVNGTIASTSENKVKFEPSGATLQEIFEQQQRNAGRL